jgi:hypothetical protein
VKLYINSYEEDPLFKSLSLSKSISTYGKKLAEHVCHNGRIWDRISTTGDTLGKKKLKHLNLKDTL